MKQDLIICRLSSVVCHLSCLFGPLQLSRVLYKSALFMQNKANVKIGKMNLRLVETKDYENKQRRGRRKNKPKQSQSKPILERMNVNYCATGYYQSKSATCACATCGEANTGAGIRVAGKPTLAVQKGRKMAGVSIRPVSYIAHHLQSSNLLRLASSSRTPNVTITNVKTFVPGSKCPPNAVSSSENVICA